MRLPLLLSEPPRASAAVDRRLQLRLAVGLVAGTGLAGGGQLVVKLRGALLVGGGFGDGRLESDVQRRGLGVGVFEGA